MESMSNRIEEAYQKKASLLARLLSCLNLERENLISLNIKNLWSIMEEKENLLTSIGDAEREIQAAQGEEGGSVQNIPKDVRPSVKALSQEIRRLKSEISARVKENVSFIQETLHFFDEIISIFASGNRAESLYEPHPKRARVSSSLIYEKEV